MRRLGRRREGKRGAPGYREALGGRGCGNGVRLRGAVTGDPPSNGSPRYVGGRWGRTAPDDWGRGGNGPGNREGPDGGRVLGREGGGG